MLHDLDEATRRHNLNSVSRTTASAFVRWRQSSTCSWRKEKDEMSETTLEEARRCPKCEQPGESAGVRPATGIDVTRGAQLHTFVCMNKQCRWYGQVCRIVQVNPDGSIPEPGKRDKHYPPIPDLTDQVNAAVERQLGLETSKEGTAEIQR
jgi:hypothetical protein